MNRLFVLCALAGLLVVPAASAATRASITLNQQQPVPDGSTVTFSYVLPDNSPSPRIVLYCYDAAGKFVWGQGQWIADGTSFTLYPSVGITSCTAKLGTFRSWFKELASTTFVVT